MNILFIDSETTGTDATKHTAIEISCRLDVNGQTVSRFTRRFFNPTNAAINLGALRVNKVPLKELIDLGISKEGKEDAVVVELVESDSVTQASAILVERFSEYQFVENSFL